MESHVPDPYHPDWQPEYTGPNPNLGNVGSGEDFGTDLYQLYLAGRVHIPETAEQFNDLATAVHRTHAPSVRAFAVAGSYDRAHRLWMDLRDDLQEVFRETCLNMDAVGRALVAIADLYVQTDEEAVESFTGKLVKDRVNQPDQFVDGPPAVPAPPSPAD